MELSIRIDNLFKKKLSIYQKSGELVCRDRLHDEYKRIKSWLYRNHEACDIIAIQIQDNYHYLLSLLACMEIGLTYIPLNENWPSSRVDQIKKLSGFKSLLNHDKLKEALTEEISSSKKAFQLKPDMPLYIMFTSGSTGQPKGVLIERNSYENFLSWIECTFSEISSDDRLLNSTDYTFDVSLMEVGLLIVKNVQFMTCNSRNIMEFIRELVHKKINISVTVPVNFTSILTERFMNELDITSLKYVILAGERFPVDLINKFKQYLPDITLYNCYGPTEATIYCVAKKIDLNTDDNVEDNCVSIGSALPGCRAKSLVEGNREAKPYEAGELVISGKQLMREYVAQEKQTQETFTLFNQDKYYKTGDIVFQNNRGDFFVRGRLDDTIKVNGQRVNLSDINEYIQRLDVVETSSTIGIYQSNAYKIIVFVSVSESEITSAHLKDQLKKILIPQQMPYKMIIIDEFPLSQSGKIDRKRLEQLFFEGKY